MHAAEGILTTRGGMTSHAAVVARGMGKPCVSGAGALRVDYAAQTMQRRQRGAQARRLHHHRRLDRPGAGRHASPMIEPALSGEFATLMGWADKVRTLGVRANADTPADARARRASSAPRASGSAAPSTCSSTRTRIHAVREMILADDEKAAAHGARQAAADAARATSSSCSRSWTGLPVTIRLLDPPLHEFLPHGDEEIAEVAAAHGRRSAEARATARSELHEFNPMLGFRGCRLAIAYPGDRRDAGARDLRGGGRGRQAHRQAGGAGGHDPADRHQGRARPRQGAHRRDGARR